MKQQQSETLLPNFTVLERAVIYARVSTDEQAESGTSIDNQVEKSSAYAEANNLKVMAIFKEDYTGKVLDRPELNKVREMLRRGQADSLIVYKPNRLDRSEWGVNLLILMQELKAMGISLHYAQDGRKVDLNNPMECFMFGSFAGWQAGEDHRETVTKLLEGRLAKARQNNPIVHDRAPYGYYIVRDGKKWALEIDETQASVIRLIFTWYVYGDEAGRPLSAYAIAKKLTKMGIPTRADTDPSYKKSKRAYGEWYKATVGYLLGCETYAGVWHYNKRGKSKRDWIPVKVPAIIDQELWKAAQAMKKQKKADASRNTRHQYLLAKRLTCGACNDYKIAGFRSSSRGNVYAYYRCGGIGHGIKCVLPHFRADKVDTAVWQWLEKILTDPDRLEEELRKYQAEQRELIGPLEEQIATIDTLLRQHNTELDEAIISLKSVASPRAKARIAADIERIEGVLDGLELQKAQLTEQLEIKTLTDEQIITITRWSVTVAKGLEETRNNFERKRHLIELLDVRGRLVVEDGEKVIYVQAKFTTEEKRLSLETKTTSCLRRIVVKRET